MTELLIWLCAIASLVLLAFAAMAIINYRAGLRRFREMEARHREFTAEIEGSIVRGARRSKDRFKP